MRAVVILKLLSIIEICIHICVEELEDEDEKRRACTQRSTRLKNINSKKSNQI